MTECLLCSKALADVPSWKSLLSLEEIMKICDSCSNQFEKAEIREEGSVIDHITSLYTYNEAMKEYLHQFKFLQDIALADVFKKDTTHCFKRACKYCADSYASRKENRKNICPC